MAPLLAPFYDNLKTILKGDSKEDPEQLKIQADDLIASDLVEICAFAYLRGRSIPNSYMIIDEAQNLTVSSATSTRLTRPAWTSGPAAFPTSPKSSRATPSAPRSC